ncbi:MAG: hypothetical protein KUG81_08690 [Gammaproteobacteria bacterium]|nr:hypothetical protein [Gammaproteobacteria bacterium]
MSSLIMEDSEYKKIDTFLRTKKFNTLRVWIEEKIDELEVVQILTPGFHISQEIEICNRIDNVVTDYCVNAMT